MPKQKKKIFIEIVAAVNCSAWSVWLCNGAFMVDEVFLIMFSSVIKGLLVAFNGDHGRYIPVDKQ